MTRANSEIWKDIDGYEGLYKISNKGNVFSIKRNTLMHPTNNGNGYLIVGLTKNTRKNQYIHRLVANAFLANENNYKYVNHKDYNTMNNEYNNLEWCSQKDNVKYSCERMKHENINNSKKSKTGFKYIYWNKKYNGYRVHMPNIKEKYFKNIDDAICYRDEIINKNKNYYVNDESRDVSKCNQVY